VPPSALGERDAVINPRVNKCSEPTLFEGGSSSGRFVVTGNPFKPTL
jgi:hypothetical protein